jgi:hypothetical protein
MEQSGYMDAHSGERLAQGRGAAMFRRHLKVAPLLEVVTGLHKRAIEMGDVIELTHPIIPNHETGVRGFTSRRVEVIEREEDPRSRRMRFTLALYDYKRHEWTGPAGAITAYGSATAAEKEYGYTADTGSPPGNFADGGEPYEAI